MAPSVQTILLTFLVIIQFVSVGDHVQAPGSCFLKRLGDLATCQRDKLTCMWTALFTSCGDPSKAGECAGDFDTRYPYLVSIRRPGSRSHVCTGTLIRENIVLTAAHCVDPDSVYSAGRLPIVHIGQRSVDDVDDNVEVIIVEESFIHPDWNYNQRSPFNAALLLLGSKSQKQYPVLLFDNFQLKTGQQLAALGWGAGGKTIEIGSDIFGSAKSETQEFIAPSHCNRTSLWNGTIPQSLYCGLNYEQRASCLVDSGSPLVLVDQPKHNERMGLPSLDFLVGFNIDGAPCGATNKPDICTNITQLYDWIMQTISI